MTSTDLKAREDNAGACIRRIRLAIAVADGTPRVGKVWVSDLEELIAHFMGAMLALAEARAVPTREAIEKLFQHFGYAREAPRAVQLIDAILALLKGGKP